MAIGALLKSAGSFMGSDKGSNLLGTAMGAGQFLAGKIKQKKADSMIPDMEDPEQRALQRQFARQKRAFQTGTANNTSRNALKQMMQSGIKESFKYGAGTRGLNAMNQMYQQGLSGINQSGQEEARAYAGAEADVINTMAQRKLELGMEKYDREQARAAQLITDGKRNVGSSLARMVNNREGSLSTDGGMNPEGNPSDVSTDKLKRVGRFVRIGAKK